MLGIVDRSVGTTLAIAVLIEDRKHHQHFPFLFNPLREDWPWQQSIISWGFIPTIVHSSMWPWPVDLEGNVKTVCCAHFVSRHKISYAQHNGTGMACWVTTMLERLLCEDGEAGRSTLVQ
jgi:hypothetical protein